MRVLFVTNSLGFGGAEKMITFIANSFYIRGNDVAVANLNCVPDYVNSHMQPLEDGVKVFSFEKRDNKGKKSYYIKGIKKIAKNFKADVIIGFTGFPNMYASIVGKLLGIPSIISERGDPSKTTGTTLKARICRAIINSSRGGVFQTEGAMKFYSKRLQKRGVVIPNPIFINGEISNVKYDDCEKSVVSVGRLDNFQKRYDIMLDAFKLFSVKHPEYILKLYGKGDDEEKIRSWVSEKELTDKVVFMGLTTQPMQDICGDGMFLITSDFEGISNSLLEAMAVGLPCVSTDHTPGGARLLITNHENGILAPIGDAMALANAMCEFAENPELAKRCGENAKDVVNRFAPERIIDMWEDYISGLCK